MGGRGQARMGPAVQANASNNGNHFPLPRPYSLVDSRFVTRGYVAVVTNRGRSPLLRRPLASAPAPEQDFALQVEQVRHALQVLQRAPHLSAEARRRGTRALEAACSRLSRGTGS